MVVSLLIFLTIFIESFFHFYRHQYFRVNFSRVKRHKKMPIDARERLQAPKSLSTSFYLSVTINNSEEET